MKTVEASEFMLGRCLADVSEQKSSIGTLFGNIILFRTRRQTTVWIVKKKKKERKCDILLLDINNKYIIYIIYLIQNIICLL